MKHYDAVVIGAGPGGYEAALELGRAGVKTLLIERSKEKIGGTCLNEGCIPAKNYLESAEYASKASYFSDCGVVTEMKGLDLSRLREKTGVLLRELRSGIVWGLDQAGVEMAYGSAAFLDSHRIEVAGESIEFENCIIATGSQFREIPNVPLDGKRIISSREVFELERLPASIAIIGGGPIGCEFATFFSAFGVGVTVIQRREMLLNSEDPEVAKALMREFKKRHIRLITSATVEEVNVTPEGVELRIKAENPEELRCEMVLCATGRTPYTEGLHLEKIGVLQSEKGFIEVNRFLQTSQPHIYALGDCIDTPPYAHTAYAEADIAAHNILGQKIANTPLSPSVIFSHPQIASCGVKEEEANTQGIAIEIKKAYFKVNSKAKINGDDSGFAKLIVSSESGVILGGSIIGGEATEIIHEILLAVEKKMTFKEIKTIVHVHPSLSEIVRFL
jgi:dihydrolipoamide dehydrogenase